MQIKEKKKMKYAYYERVQHYASGCKLESTSELCMTTGDGGRRLTGQEVALTHIAHVCYARASAACLPFALTHITTTTKQQQHNNTRASNTTTRSRRGGSPPLALTLLSTRRHHNNRALASINQVFFYLLSHTKKVHYEYNCYSTRRPTASSLSLHVLAVAPLSLSLPVSISRA